MAGTGEQGTGMSASVGVRASSGRQQLPGSARFFLLFPRQVTGEQIEGIDLLRVRPGTRLKIRAGPWPLNRRCAPSCGKVGMIAQVMWFGLGQHFTEERA